MEGASYIIVLDLAETKLYSSELIRFSEFHNVNRESVSLFNKDDNCIFYFGFSLFDVGRINSEKNKYSDPDGTINFIDSKLIEIAKKHPNEVGMAGAFIKQINNEITTKLTI